MLLPTSGLHFANARKDHRRFVKVYIGGTVVGSEVTLSSSEP